MRPVLYGALLVLALGTPPRVSSAEQSADASGNAQEVLVTARKSEERLQDVPIPMSVISAGELTTSSQLLLRDYYESIPGLNVSPNFLGATTLTIRGVATGSFGNPTVAVLIDDLPFTMSTGVDGGDIPDIDPGDLTRIETLRGPQGSLYGAGSMGGLIKYVTIDPSTQAFSGRLEAGVSGVHNGPDPGYNVRGSANMPVNDDFAVRLSGFTRRDPGYIDNVVSHRDGINSAQVSGARLSSLWRPMDGLSIKLSALFQYATSSGLSEIDKPTEGYPDTLGLRDLQQNYIPGVGGSRQETQAYSAVAKTKVGIADITSLTGYNRIRLTGSFDTTPLFGDCCTGPYLGVTGSPYITHHYNSKFSEELRASIPLGSSFEWLLGGFYTFERSRIFDVVVGQDPAAVIVGELYRFDNPTAYAEYAAFTALTYHITDRFDVQVGARQSHIKATTYQGESAGNGPLYNPAVITPEQISDANAFTYLVTPRYKLTKDLMVYGRLASGYRPGQPNPGCDAFGFPCQYGPDKTQTYELGAKGDLLGQLLSVDASLYYISWKKIQIQLTTGGPSYQSYVTNGSAAKSEGVELSLTARPTSGLTISGWASYDNAVLTQALPPESPVVGNPGDRLPFTSRFSANLSVQQNFPLWSRGDGFVGGAVGYVGDRVSIFEPAGTNRLSFPTYAKLDLRAGVKSDSWSTTLYVNNVADRRGILDGSIGNDLFPYAYVIIAPRTVGISVSKEL